MSEQVMDTELLDSAIATFGFNPASIGLRNRAWWIVEEVEEEEVNGNAQVGYLAVRARDGGGNPIDPKACEHKNFVGTAEDSLGPTYRYYYYRPLEEHEKVTHEVAAMPESAFDKLSGMTKEKFIRMTLEDKLAFLFDHCHAHTPSEPLEVPVPPAYED